MSNKSFILRKAYILSGIKKDGSRVFYDIDDHSGGWPYWSTSTYNPKEFGTLKKVPTIGPKDYMRNDVVSIEVLEVKLQARIVDSSEIASEAKVKAMVEIEKIQKDLAKKIAMLEGMK